LPSLAAKLAAPAVGIAGAALGGSQGTPPLHRSLLRNKHAGSAESNASSGGALPLCSGPKIMRNGRHAQK
jgi:hypothetical protein